MTIGGSGVGGNIGGPQIPLQRDVEATAWTEVNKAELGIGPNGVDIPFQQIISRYTPGYLLGSFGYRTTSENPLLDHPLEVQRRAESSGQQADNSWQTHYQNFINQLPPELLARFNAENSKPFEQRSLTFISLDNTFQLAAKILAQLEGSSKAAPSESLEASRTTLNLLMPFAALKSVLQNGQEVAQSAKQLLEDQGPNYRHFDGLNNLLTQLQSPLNLIAKVYDGLNDTKGTQLSQQGINAASKAAQQLAIIGLQLERTSLGTDLQILLPTIKSLEAVSSALSLPNTASASLFLALYVATTGIFINQSPLGLFDKGFETLTTNLNVALTSGLMPTNNKAGNELLSNLVTVSFALLSGLTSLSVQSGFGLYPLRDPKDVENARFFAFETALHFAASSGLLETFYKEVIAISGGNAQAQELGSNILAHVAILAIIMSASNDVNKATRLIEDLSARFAKSLTAANEIEKEDEKRADRKEDNDKRTALAIAIKLANTALESKNYEAYLEAINNLLESLGTTQNALKQDLSKIGSATTIVAGITSMGDPNQQMTGIINII